uniref:PHD-type domain-containing protein n=1 Tax=Ananas comosus var. bracteatus TaxID=296719 RepID=A0A6V7QQF8_ANACO
MESATTVHGLPPSKRFKLLHSFDPHIQNPKSLPAKKRADLRDGTNPICLPAKKREHRRRSLGPIVFCDGCDLMVHALCYGNPLARSIPEGDWFCLRCDEMKTKNAMESNTNCCLCSAEGGAVKPTVDGEWAHITCSLLVPEVFFHDPEGRDRIDCSRVPERRWRKRCYVCESGRGCAIECSEPKCELVSMFLVGSTRGCASSIRKGSEGLLLLGSAETIPSYGRRIVAREDAPKRKARA